MVMVVGTERGLKGYDLVNVKTVKWNVVLPASPLNPTSRTQAVIYLISIFGKSDITRIKKLFSTLLKKI